MSRLASAPKVQTLTWRMPGGPLRLLRGHPASVLEAFTALVAAGAVDIAIASETAVRRPGSRD